MRFGVIDLETKGLGGDIVLIGAYDGQEFRTFKKLFDLTQYLLNHVWCRTWYAHNGGGYDYRYFLDDGPTRALIDRSSILLINGRLASFKFKSGVSFRDSYCLLPQGLNALSVGFGFGGKMEYDDYENHSDPLKLSKYLRDDCEQLYAILRAFRKEVPTEPRLTLAGTALAVWRGMYPKYWRWLREHKLSAAAEEFIREGYCGGRVEVFNQMGANLSYFDVNSMYPTEMLKGIPWGYWDWSKDALAERAYSKKLPGIYAADVDVPPMNIPPLPRRKGGKLLFPIGKLSGVWALPELLYAESLGVDIRRITKAVVFKEEREIFTDYVRRFWQMKNEGTGAKRTVAKLLLNSLYGKFGQRSEYSNIVGPNEAMERLKAGESIEVFDREMGLYIASEKARRDFIRPEIAAYITSRARISLHKGMNYLENSGYTVYYCDTDSIITDFRGVCLDREFRSGKAMGEWEREKEIDLGVFIAPKTYILKRPDGTEEVALKGIPMESAKGLTLEDARALVTGKRKRATMKVKRLVGLGEVSRRLDTRKARHRFRLLVSRERSVKVNTDKRRKGVGFKTNPRRLKEWGK